jgi:structural maintenance of chromosome 1
LDNANVAKVAKYIMKKVNEDRTGQFLVISLKSSLYEKASSLIGVYREQSKNSSSVLTLKLSDYAE